MRTFEEITRLLAANGFKRTRQRIAVLAALHATSGPLTAEEVFLKLRAKGTPVCLATVYRMLDQFGAKGLVTKHTPAGSSRAQYEAAGLHHTHHLRCVSCNATVPIAGCPLGDLEERLESQTAYAIRGHMLEVFGLCPRCQ